jgi:SAM-dependent methyltransferase
MAQGDRIFAGSIPELYDRYLGPLIFRPYAEIVAAQVSLTMRDAAPVLETAAGTGILTRLLARSVRPGSELIATDLNQPMLDFAAGQAGASGISWQQADALSLPFPADRFEIVVCQFGAMFFPDKVAAYREAKRVLRPGGALVLAVWDRIEENEFTDVVTTAVAALFPSDPPSFLARTPHGYHDKARIRADLTDAGYGDIVIETSEQRSRAESPEQPAIGFCQGTPLRNEIVARDPAALADATDAATAALIARFGRGPIEGKIQAHIITAVA